MVISKQYCLENGGATLNASLEVQTFKRGFMVSMLGTERTFKNIDELFEELEGFKYIKQLFFIGIWFDEATQLWFLDNSKHISNKREAIKIGKKNKQLAIFDWANNEAIFL